MRLDMASKNLDLHMRFEVTWIKPDPSYLPLWNDLPLKPCDLIFHLQILKGVLDQIVHERWCALVGVIFGQGEIDIKRVHR